MNSNAHSIRPPSGTSGGLAGLASVADELAAQDLDGLADSVRAERVLVLRRLLDRLEGQWLKELAGSMPAAPGGQRHADALAELARRAWKQASCPNRVGCGPS